MEFLSAICTVLCAWCPGACAYLQRIWWPHQQRGDPFLHIRNSAALRGDEVGTGERDNAINGYQKYDMITIT